jgi:hypothetical protein
VTFSYNGYLYLLGGILNNNSFSDTIYFTSSTSSGDLNPWETTNWISGQYPFSGNSVIYNGYAYVFPQIISPIANTNSYAPVSDFTGDFAPISLSGGVGAWQEVGSPLYYSPPGGYASVGYYSGMAVYNNYFYQIGGYGSDGGPTTTVLSIPATGIGTGFTYYITIASGGIE